MIYGKVDGEWLRNRKFRVRETEEMSQQVDEQGAMGEGRRKKQLYGPETIYIIRWLILF